MATLFNTKISATYEGLFKTIDNAAITASLKELTDGSGNQSGLYVNNAGDFKVSNILEWGSLKDTGTGVTITRYVTSTDGIENFDNNTSLPTSAAVKLYVDTKFSQTDTLQEVLSFGNTTGGNDIVVSASDDITFTDSSKAIFGAGSDLQIYHDSSNISYIKHNTSSDFRIQTSSTGYIKLMAELENMAVFIPNSAVELYFDNSKKLATTNTGVDVTGNLVVSGSITGAGGSFLPLAGGTMTGNIVLNDNVKSIYGTASDGLEIYHDGSNSLIADTGTGLLNIRSNEVRVTNAAGNEIQLQAIENSSVKLYFDGSERFYTTNTGVQVIGALSTTTNVSVGANATFVDNGKALFGSSNDLQIYHDGSNSYINEAGTGTLKILTNGLEIKNPADNGYMAFFGATGSAELYFNTAKKFETLTDGAKVTGNLEVTGTITGSGGSFLPLAGGTMTGTILCADNKGINIGASNDLQITHNGSTAGTIKNTSGNFNIQQSAGGNIFIEKDDGENMAAFRPDAAVELYYNGSQKLATTNTGISVTGNGVFTGNVYIETNNRLVLGNSSEVELFYDGTDGRFLNTTGDLRIDQSAVTKSIVFRVSDANALDTTALTISRNADASFGRDVTIAGDLTVNGTTTTVNSQTLAVVDPLIQLAKDNTANSLDIGLYGDYNDGTDRFLGLFSDASDSNKFKLFKGTTVEPTTTVDIGGAGYVAADLVVAELEATTGTFAGNINVDTNANALLTLDGSSGSTEGIIIKHSGTEVSRISHSNSTSLVFSTGSSVTTALTLDSSQNATFAGTINSGTITSTGNVNCASLVATSAIIDNVVAKSTNGNIVFKKNTGATIAAFNNDLSSTFQGSVTSNAVPAFLVGTVGAIGNTANDVNIYSVTTGHNGLRMHANGILPTDNTGTIIDNDADLGDVSYRFKDLYLAGSIISSGAAGFTGDITISKTYPKLILNDTQGVQRKFSVGVDNETFTVRNETSGSNSFTIAGSNNIVFFAGNVGIKDTPSFALDVNVVNSRARFKAATGDAGIELSSIVGHDWLIESKSDDSFSIYDEDEAKERLNISNTGTATFNGMLDIIGSRSTYVNNAEDDSATAHIFTTDAQVGDFAQLAGSLVLQARVNDAIYRDIIMAGGLGTVANPVVPILTVKGEGVVEIDGSFSVSEGSTFTNMITIDIDDISTGENRGVRIINSNGIAQQWNITAGVTGQENDSFCIRNSTDNQNSLIINRSGFANFASGANFVSQVRINNSSSALGKLAVKSTSGASTFYNNIQCIPSDATTGGLFIGSNVTNDAIMVTGAYYKNAGKYTPTATSASIINMYSGNIRFFGDTGLTIGTEYTPTQRMNITSGGQVQVGYYNTARGGANTTFMTGKSGTTYLELNGGDTSGEGGILFADGSGGNYGLINYSHVSDIMQFYTSSTERLRITSGGDVLVGNASAFTIGTHDPNVITQATYGVNNGSNVASYGLDRIHFDSSNYYVLNASAIGVKLVNGATAWTAQSDESLKENIKPLENVLDKIKDYRCVEYNLKANNNKKIGFIAQDWENDFAPIVNKDDEGLLGMKYTETIPVLLKAIQELKAEVDLLKKECKCKN